MNLDWNQLSHFAKARAEGAAPRPTGQPQQQQQQQQQQQVRSTPQPNMPGSQHNPIEIVTPNLNSKPQLPNQPNIPSFVTPQQQLQPAAPIIDQRFQQSVPQPQVRPPNTATKQWVQQQQQPQQQLQSQQIQQQQQQSQQPRPPVANPPQGQPKPGSGMDFSKNEFPMPEVQFWRSLGQQHMSDGQPLPPPLVEGKQVNLFTLFGLVHKSGGSAKVSAVSNGVGLETDRV